MEETTEPTRGQIEKRIAQLEALVSFPQYAAIWGTDLAVYRMALRTLDAEAQLESCRQVEACSKAFHDLVVKERDFERVRAARLEEDRDVARADLAAMTERAEKAERLSATLRAVAEQEVVDAIVKSRERATRVGWIDHATGDYEERSVDIPMDDLAVGSAVCAFLRMVGVWTLEDRAEKAERERGATSAALNDLASGLRDALDGFAMVGEKWTDAVKRLRKQLTEVERERDEAVSVRREMRVAWDGASDQRNDLRAKLEEMEAKLAAMHRRAQLAENPTTHARCEVAFQRKRAEGLRARLAEVERERDVERHLATVRGEMLSVYEQRNPRVQYNKLSNMHRRAQRAESATADARREAIGQRKRADWWRREAKRIGWTPDYPELREEQTSDARIDCESSSLLLLSTWARKVMMRPKNRAKGLPSESVEELLAMARHELTEARDAIEENAPTDDILAELGDAATCIAFAMREVEKRRTA